MRQTLRILISIVTIVAVAAIVFCLANPGVIREGIAKSKLKTMTMGKCAEKCADGHAGGSCIQECCKKHCSASHQITQECKDYCGVEGLQRNTPHHILPHVSTYPTAETAGMQENEDKTKSAAQHGESDWPKVYNLHTGKPLGNRPFPSNGELIVPSAKQLMHGVKPRDGNRAPVPV